MRGILSMTISADSSLIGLATATPETILPQSSAAEISREVFSKRFEEFDRLAPVFFNAGIKQRHISMPIEWYLEPLDWNKRTQAFLDVGTRLFCEVADKVLSKSGLLASDIDTIVTVTSTGVATPSLEARALSVMGFRTDCIRIPVFGLGCAGGVSGLSLANDLAKAQPGKVILLVVIELCSLTFRMDKLSKANIVATALFGDGAAAAIVTNGSSGTNIGLGSGCQKTWPDTLGIMGWNVEPEGLEVIFDRSIPPFVRKNMKETLGGFLSELDLAEEQLKRFSFHPGGTKVLEALEATLNLETGYLDIERDILSEFGNMSAPTALFVLERYLETKPEGLSLITALGPGFTASTLPVTVVQ